MWDTSRETHPLTTVLPETSWIHSELLAACRRVIAVTRTTGTQTFTGTTSRDGTSLAAFDVVFSSDTAENVRTSLVLDVRDDAAQRTLSTAEALGDLCHGAASGDSDAQQSLLNLVGADYYAYLTRFAREHPGSGDSP
ncbi:hypothetical protein MK786_08600 [Microbacterium sp. CFH 31415]|uniref:hypothetical protein n=1 Tax=Microbacterium sp. CFH 31415 TaxID=2921732 RepID=UPI001F1353DC|nr:hypothetical protein [Microbacterium sp. CFH 31415]MCH6230794.1 hypothetical protein [Microbacterium sp. CFH 31415]